MRYAGASGDFNPMHHDEVAAQAAGCPASSATACSRWACSDGRSPTGPGSATSDRYQVRFTKQTWPGEVLTSKIVVTGKREEAGERLVDVTVELANQDGEVKLAGAATAVAA